MHNIEEQMSIVKMRANAFKQAKKRRSRRILSLSCASVCLLCLVGAALAMPDVLARPSIAKGTNITGFASIFSNGTAMGYLVIALLGFLLGICLTILCIYLHKRSVEDKNNDRDH